MFLTSRTARWACRLIFPRLEECLPSIWGVSLVDAIDQAALFADYYREWSHRFYSQRGVLFLELSHPTEGEVILLAEDLSPVWSSDPESAHMQDFAASCRDVMDPSHQVVAYSMGESLGDDGVILRGPYDL